MLFQICLNQAKKIAKAIIFKLWLRQWRACSYFVNPLSLFEKYQFSGSKIHFGFQVYQLNFALNLKLALLIEFNKVNAVHLDRCTAVLWVWLWNFKVT